MHACTYTQLQTHTDTQVDFLEISVVTVTDRLYQKTGSDIIGCGVFLTVIRLLLFTSDLIHVFWPDQ